MRGEYGVEEWGGVNCNWDAMCERIKKTLIIMIKLEKSQNNCLLYRQTFQRQRLKQQLL